MTGTDLQICPCHNIQDTSSTPNILFVVHNFPPHWFAGVEIYTYNLAKELTTKGYRVSVLYPKKDIAARNPYLKKGGYNGITTFTMHYYDTDNLEKQIKDEDVEKIFKDLIDRERFDIVHFHHVKGLPVSILDIAKRHNMSVFLTLHDFWLICLRFHLYIDKTNELCDGPLSIDKCVTCISINLNKDINPLIKKKLHSLISYRQEYVRELLDRVDVISSPSKYLAEKFSSFGFAKNKIVVLPFGLNPITKIKNKYKSSEVCFGYIGSVQVLKNTVFLAEAFKSVHGNARLIFWGNGHPDIIDRLKDTIKSDERIEYRGAYRPDELPRILSEVDVVVVPSLIENSPFVIREALSVDIPVVASNVGGIPEIIFHMKNGILFESNNKEELSSRMQEIVDDPSIIQRLRNAIEPLKTVEEEALEWTERYNSFIKHKQESSVNAKPIDNFLKIQPINIKTKPLMIADMCDNIRLLEAKNGSLTLKIKCADDTEKAIHSLYDPVAEARNIVNAFQFDGEGILVVLGLGLGYHVIELLKKFPEANIIVVEAMPEIYELSKKYGRVSEIENKVKLLTGCISDEVISEITGYQIKLGMPPLYVFTLSSAVSAFSDYYRPITKKLNNITTVRLWDKLRYPKFKQDTLKIALIDFHYFLNREVEKAIKGLGHKVAKVTGNIGESVGDMLRKMTRTIIDFRPDFIFTINHFGFDEEGVFADFLRSIKIPVASWFVDSPNIIVKAFDKNVSPLVSIFLWDKEYINDMKGKNFESVYYLPLATDEEVFRPLTLSTKELKKYGADVGFAGNSMVKPTNEKLKKVNAVLHPLVERLVWYLSSYRLPFGEALKTLNDDESEKIKLLDTQDRLDFEAAVLWRSTLLYRLSCLEKIRDFKPRIHGDRGWQMLLDNNFMPGPLLNYYKELPIFYNACKINFNATNLQMRSAVNQRVFDVPACGGFILTDHQDAIDELFERGTEVVTYKAIDEIPDLVRFYLRHPESRRVVANKGRERVLKEHTYKHRLDRIIHVMKERYG